jgi:hypothetical protein
MTRLEVAEGYAQRARTAQSSGDHRRAAELFAEALRLLALPFQQASEEIGEAEAARHRDEYDVRA